MKVSERNFLASQALYGLMIAKNAELPPLIHPDRSRLHFGNHCWMPHIDHLTELAFDFADAMIERGKNKQAKKC